MPARPVMLDEIELKMKGAVTKDIVTPICCFKTCGEKGTAMLVLRYPGGKTDAYVLCKKDLARILENHPNSLGKPIEQGVFLY